MSDHRSLWSRKKTRLTEMNWNRCGKNCCRFAFSSFSSAHLNARWKNPWDHQVSDSGWIIPAPWFDNRPAPDAPVICLGQDRPPLRGGHGIIRPGELGWKPMVSRRCEFQRFDVSTCFSLFELRTGCYAGQTVPNSVAYFEDFETKFHRVRASRNNQTASVATWKRCMFWFSILKLSGDASLHDFVIGTVADTWIKEEIRGS